MPGPIAIAGIAAGADIAAQGIQALSNKRSQKRAFRYNLDMWNRQNAYNLPKAQMARYREAGLNPNLMYGQGNPGNAQQLPKYQAEEYKYQAPDVLNMLGQYSQIKNIDANTENTQVETAIKNIDKQIRTLQHDEEIQAQHWRRYPNKTYHYKGSNYSAQRDLEMFISKERLELEKARKSLTKEMVSKAQTFNKYLNVSQQSQIIARFLPILNLLKLLK